MAATMLAIGRGRLPGSRVRRQRSIDRAGALLRRLPAAAGFAHPRRRLHDVPGLGGPSHPTLLRHLRRRALVLAHSLRRCLRPLPGDSLTAHDGPGAGSVRWRPPRDAPRPEVRRPPHDRLPVEPDDAGTLPGSLGGRRRYRPGSAALAPPVGPWIQSGGGPGRRPRPAGAARAATATAYPDADRPAGRRAARQRPPGLRGATPGDGQGPLPGGCGRRADDRRDDRRVCAGVEGSRCPGGQGPYGSCSRDATVRRTSAATSSFERSPLISAHPGAWAWLR